MNKLNTVEMVKKQIADLKKELDSLKPNFNKITKSVTKMKKTDEDKLIKMLSKYSRKKLLAYVYKKSTRDRYLKSWVSILPMLKKSHLITLLLKPVENIELKINFSKNNVQLTNMMKRGNISRKKRNVVSKKKTPMRTASGKTPPQNKYTHDV